MADISIPEGDNPVRYQASLGGNQKYRNMGNVSGQAYLVRGQVTNVYYQKGTLDFNTYGSSITSGVTDGSGSAPIPVDFWGKNTDGKVFGCYRPVQKGSQILVAYIGGDTSRPIVIGVYPDNEASYELISPVHYNTGDDSTDDVQNDALGERKIYPNQQMMYESGKGDILRSMGGKSFLYISENGSGYLDDINYAYDEIRDFYDADANEIEPTMTKAQSWLLVHEDNESDEAADGHRTRFYVNRSGELMVTFANNNDPNEIVVLEASKDSGFKLTKRFDNSNLKEDSEDYVQFGIGNGNNVSIKSVDSGDATSFYLDNGNIRFDTPKEGSITFDGVPVSAILGRVSDAENVANKASDKATVAASAGAIAQSAARDAASQALVASQAGEDAKSAAVNAQAAGEDAKAQAKDTRDRIIYYSSISNEKDVAIPGKYIIINTDTYIKNGTIKTAHIGDAAITNAKIANLAVGTAQLEDAAITRAKIGNLAVGTAQIEDAAITDAKVGTLSANHLNAGTIDFSVISGIHINASEIDVGKIVADQIFVNGLGEISKNLGTVTSGKITGTNVNDDVENAQSTADNAVGGVNNLNDPNLMSVIEKQTTSKQYAGLTSQYNVILSRAKEDNISTTALTTAYTNLNNFMTPFLADTTKASNIDRYTYNSLTYTYNMALSNVQNALKDAYNADIDNMQSSVSVASQAASSAAIVASQAAITGYNAIQAAAQATAAASQAQTAGDNATSVANVASQAASGAIIAGSQAAVNADKAINAASQAQIAGDNATSVANNATIIANSATSTADNAFSEAQAVGSQASSEIAVQSQATAKAQSTADNAFSQAQIVGSQANSAISVQSAATAKAQSTADSAFSQAVTAIDTGQAVSQAVTSLKDGSTLTIAELGNGLATKVSNSEYASYKDQTASQIGQLVTNGAFSAYQSTTADLIASKVATKDFSAYQATTAKSIESKVESSDFNTYKTQTADLINDKVSSSEYASDKTQTASQISQMVSNSAFSAYQTQTASQIASKVDNGDFSTYKTQTADLISSKVATKDFTAYQATTDKSIESKVESKAFETYQQQTDTRFSTTVKAVQTQIQDSAVGTNLAIGTGQEYSMGYGINITTWQDGYAYEKLPTTIYNNAEILPQTSNFWYTMTKGVTYTQTIWLETDATVKDLSAAQITWFTWAGHDGQPATVVNLGGNKYKIYSTYMWPDKGDNNNVRLFDIFYLASAFDFNTGTYLKFGKLKLEKGSLSTDWCLNPAETATQSDITQSINNIHLGFKNPDGSSFQMNLSADGVALMDFSKIILNGTTNIANGTIGTAQIGDGAITNAKIGKLAVGTAQIANGAITNAQIGAAAVGTAQIKDAAISSAKIADLAVGTAQIGDGAITNAKIGKLAVGTAQIANAAITDAQVGNVSANKLTAGTIDFNTITGKNINASNITTGKLDTNRLNVDKLSAVSANLGDVTTGSLKGVDIVANTFSTPNGSFTTDSNGNVVASNLTIRGVTNLVYNAALLGGSGSYIPGWGISNNGYYASNMLFDGVPSIGWNNSAGAGVWNIFAQTKLHPLNGATSIPFSASVWFLECGSDTNLKYQFTLAFFDSNSNRINGGFAGNTWNGISSSQGWRYVTIDNVVIPNNVTYVGLQFWSYNGHGNAYFSSPMLTQSAHSTGYQPDTGNIINAGIITGSTINAGTINTNANNTASFYPFTADSSGKISSYSVDDHFASYARMYSGNIVISDRNMDANSGSNNYGGETAVIGGSSISLSAGYTVGKDTDFTKPLVAEGEPGTTQLVLSGITGITLKGDDQKIHFHGMYSDSQPKGITFTPYGNINGDEGSTTGNWYVGYNLANMTAQFGIDNLSKNTINLYRPTFVDEIGAIGNRLDNGRLLLHAVDGDAQMYLLNDGQPGFVSPTIYNRTYPNGANVFVTSYGRIGRSTSASKYKLDITKETSISPANKLLSIDRSSWVDKNSAELLADSKANGTELSEPEINVNRHYGLIAEDLIKAGLDEFVIKGANGQAEGIEYDRLWTVLIPKIRDLSNNQINDRMTISRLEKEIEKLKQEVQSK